MLGEAQSQSAAQTLRIGYIGPGKKPAYATGWALQQGILQRELSTLGFSQVVTVMNQGEVLAMGSPAEVQGHPGVIEAYLGSSADLSSLRREAAP